MAGVLCTYAELARACGYWFATGTLIFNGEYRMTWLMIVMFLIAVYQIIKS
jgi:hypothetical protein